MIPLFVNFINNSLMTKLFRFSLCWNNTHYCILWI